MMMNGWLAVRKPDTFLMDGGVVVPMDSLSMVELVEVVGVSEDSKIEPGWHILYIGNAQEHPSVPGVQFILESCVIRRVEKDSISPI